MEEQIKDNDVPIVDLEKLVEEGELKELDFSLLSTFSNQFRIFRYFQIK